MILAGGEIRCVLFDAVGTLIYPHPSVAEAYQAVASRHGSSLSEALILDRFRGAFRRLEIIDAGPNGCLTDEARELRRWKAIVADTLHDVRDAAAAFEELWRHFSLPDSWRLYDDVADTWRKLTAMGLRLGIASNFDGRLHGVCHGLPPLDDCRDIFVSSELGVRKPAADFFRRLEKRLQLGPRQIVLVGDDLENDYHAARQAGWQAVFLDRCGEADAPSESIRSLGQLPDRILCR